jgi:hypothetical protein
MVLPKASAVEEQRGTTETLEHKVSRGGATVSASKLATDVKVKCEMRLNVPGLCHETPVRNKQHGLRVKYERSHAMATTQPDGSHLRS